LRSVRFPPGPRDAPLLGGTVLELLAAERGEPAVARLCQRLPRTGAQAALVQAFGGGSAKALEQRWRTHLQDAAVAG
jgi:hypothetical protein